MNANEDITENTDADTEKRHAINIFFQCPKNKGGAIDRLLRACNWFVFGGFATKNKRFMDKFYEDIPYNYDITLKSLNNIKNGNLSENTPQKGYMSEATKILNSLTKTKQANSNFDFDFSENQSPSISQKMRKISQKKNSLLKNFTSTTTRCITISMDDSNYKIFKATTENKSNENHDIEEDDDIFTQAIKHPIKTRAKIIASSILRTIPLLIISALFAYFIRSFLGDAVDSNLISNIVEISFDAIIATLAIVPLALSCCYKLLKIEAQNDSENSKNAETCKKIITKIDAFCNFFNVFGDKKENMANTGISAKKRKVITST